MSITNLEFRDKIKIKEIKEPVRREIIGGKIYNMASPATNHNKVINNMIRMFGDFLDDKTCTVFGENVDVYFDDKDKEVKPDLKIVCDPDKITDEKIIGAPDFAVEVLSKSNPEHDKITKLALYEKFRVKEYWIISIPEKSIDVYLLTEGKLVLSKIYTHYSETEIKNIEEGTDEEAKERVKIKNITTSIFGDDLKIPIEKIFRNLR